MENEMLLRAGNLEIREIDEGERTITGLITTDAVDRYNEVVDPSGVILDNYLRNPVVLLNHFSWGLPIGKNMWIKKEKKGLLAKTQFADTLEAMDVFKLYKDGFMKAWSIGFIPRKTEVPEDPQVAGYRRKFISWELLEYSAVTIPANPEALTNALDRLESPRLREIISGEINIDRVVSAVHSSADDALARVAALEERIAEYEAELAVTRRGIGDPENTDDTHNHDDDDTRPKSNEDHSTLEVPANAQLLTNAYVRQRFVEVLGEKVGKLKQGKTP